MFFGRVYPLNLNMYNACSFVYLYLRVALLTRADV
jgi:hypothetical protein